MLGIARELAPPGVPLVGINQGRLGFITDIALDQTAETLAAMLAGDYETDIAAYWMPKCDARGQDDLRRAIAERRGGHPRRHRRHGRVAARVDGEFVANQRADGLIVASPTGSTAYALSAGGPILHPGIAGLLLVPIAPQTLSNRPIVLPDGVVVEIEIADGRDASANFDMQSMASLLHGDLVRARRGADIVALPASARLELLRHAAPEAALERDAERTALARLNPLPRRECWYRFRFATS